MHRSLSGGAPGLLMVPPMAMSATVFAAMSATVSAIATMGNAKTMSVEMTTCGSAEPAAAESMIVSDGIAAVVEASLSESIRMRRGRPGFMIPMMAPAVVIPIMAPSVVIPIMIVGPLGAISVTVSRIFPGGV